MSSAAPSVVSQTAGPHVDAIRKAFRVATKDGDAPRLADAAATTIDRVGRVLRAHTVDLPIGSSGKSAVLTLPVHANEAFALRDSVSGMSVDVTMEGATDAEAIVEGGYVVYPGGHASGADMVHRPHAEGTEDYLRFASKPDAEELTYRVDMHGVEGVRLVAGTLEMLDGSGTPRLRMAPPWAADSTGEVLSPTVDLAGCSYDSDPRPPWGRPVIAPSASTCRVAIRWQSARYPLLLDPTWTTTGSVAIARYSAASSLMSDGRVLLSGGSSSASCQGVIKTTEIFDPSTATWTATGSLADNHCDHTATALAGGKAVVIGGFKEGASISYPSVIETYAEGTGVWTSTSAAWAGRHDHTATLLSTGAILVVGGVNAETSTTRNVLADTYRSNTAVTTWTAEGSLATARRAHGAALANNGKVLAVGGYDAMTKLTASVESYDTTANTWAAATALPAALSGSITVLGSGDLLMDKAYFYQSGVWSTATGSAMSGAPLANVGGNALGWSAMFIDSSKQWVDSTNGPGSSNSFDTLAGVSGGRALATVGGSTTSYLFTPLLGGATCTKPGDCASTFCVDGVCCNTACAASSACTMAKTGIPDGTCGPKIDGVACTVGTECGTGHCADAVCCNTSCASANDACVQTKTGVADGTCAPIANGIACSNGTTCGSGFCSDGVCCDKACSATNDSCLQVNTGLATGTCGPIANGVTCSSGSTCGSGNCADNFCCDTACNTLCQACSSAKSGGANGTCTSIPSGGDPDNECGSAGSGVCALPGVCDGLGSCKNEQGTQCAVGSCASTTSYQPPSTCTTAGQCNQPTSVSCGNYTCKGSACLASCGADTDCTNGTKCLNPPNGTCGMGFGPGHACTSASQCSSNSCVDQVCCGSQCSGSCQSCSNVNTGQPDGTCADVKKGADPHNDCSLGTPPCGPDGFCNGSGACNGNVLSGTSCGSPTCSGLSVVSELCDGMGTCGAVTGAPCPNGYGCKNGLCLTSCATSADCSPADSCNAGVCAPKVTNGTTCGADGQCQSGHCIENLCCDAVCNGACTSCLGVNTQGGVNGHCDLVKDGSDPKNGCVPDGMNTCGADGLCGASGQCRTAASAGTTCGSTVCVGSSSVSGQVCDGNGTCSTMGTTPCSNGYVCSAGSCLTSCGTNADCTSGHFCSQSSCVPLLSQGATCTAASQCATTFCEESVCCDAACSGNCQSCLGSQTVSGVTGKCDVVKDASDPKGGCTADAMNPCGAVGSCDGTGQCRASAIAGTICGSNVCVGTGLASETCNGTGTCVAGASSACGNGYACQSGSCPTSCADDSWCTSGYFCQVGVCVVLTAQGQSCAADGHCATGHCVDDVCCDSACSGSCSSCDGKTANGVVGKCDNTLAGTDPRSACAPDGTNTCGADGQCDGNGQCRAFAPSGLSCGATVCTGAASVSGKLCDGSGTCAAGAASTCAGNLVCSGTACLSSCGADSDCVSGFFCKGGACAAKEEVGATCSADSECGGGHCVDHFCCDQTCDSPCTSCAGVNTTGGVNGYCDNVKALSDPKNQCASDPSKLCGPDGTCNGMGACTPFATSGTTCGANECANNAAVKQQCDGFGMCAEASPVQCTPYACDAIAHACTTQCSSSADCAAGATCNVGLGQCTITGATCADAFTVLAANGTKTSCAPYKCLNGDCEPICTTPSDCAPGYSCAGTACVKSSGAGGSGGSDAAGGAGTGGQISAGAGGVAGTASGGAKASAGSPTSTAGHAGAPAQGTAGNAGAPTNAVPSSDADSGSSGGCSIEGRSTNAPALLLAWTTAMLLRRRALTRKNASKNRPQTLSST